MKQLKRRNVVDGVYPAKALNGQDSKVYWINYEI